MYAVQHNKRGLWCSRYGYMGELVTVYSSAYTACLCSGPTGGFGIRGITSIPVSQQVTVDVVDVGVDGWTAGDAARGHIGVILRVDVLKAFPWHPGAEL